MQTLEKKTDDWEQRANKVLSHFNYQNADEIDLYNICWRYGIVIKPLDQNYFTDTEEYTSINNLKSYSIPSNKARRGTIYIVPNLDPIEKRILLAEEFCHIYSHYSSQLSIDKLTLNKQESQAKRMAAYLLMPHRFLKEIYTAAMSEPILISDISDHFLVTEEFAHYRLELIYKHKIDGFIQLREQLWSLEIL
ncbi:ImmA/IrrE family metallo-endopeptidase [Bacillus sp. Au-Bac7]|uniref:ImmA/IrrE family metallo-endopeptidase n=1 Tax=Bacillus sp. Au-Bac7 TaxID=2906458 RepID=UPI001E56D8D7|nr:ImmA/IrrE family metallo-endopeptidase [Bacillus sp. Au-Bac7]MCE4048048.1 ImmA/IrrE family metallo-endopeptidase [Bacillus sp. Au-Bac7]